MYKKEENQKKIPIVCMPFFFKIMRWLKVFPPKNTELDPGGMFFLKFLFFSTLGSLPYVSSILHLYYTIYSKQYNHIEVDINYVVSFSTTFALIWSFLIKIKTAGQLYTFLSDFDEFGEPTDFDKENKTFNKYSKMHFIYLACLVWLIMLTSKVFKKESCRRENLMHNMTEVCGLFTYTWMPFDIDYTPVRQIYMLIQMVGVNYIYMIAGLMAWQVFETMQHVVVRIRDVKYVLIDALAMKDPVERRIRFNYAVRYHNAVLGLEGLLNESFSIFMFTHLVFASLVMGSGLYSLFHVKSFSTFLVCTGWFWGLFMDCVSGQRLQDESLELGYAVYDAPWYDYEEPLKKDVMYVLKKCQTPMKLRAGAFGFMERALFLGAMKVTYSYITILKNT